MRDSPATENAEFHYRPIVFGAEGGYLKVKRETSLKKSIEAFSESELNKFHLRAPAQRKRFVASLNHTASDHDKPGSQRKLV